MKKTLKKPVKLNSTVKVVLYEGGGCIGCGGGWPCGCFGTNTQCLKV